MCDLFGLASMAIVGVEDMSMLSSEHLAGMGLKYFELVFRKDQREMKIIRLIGVRSDARMTLQKKDLVSIERCPFMFRQGRRVACRRQPSQLRRAPLALECNGWACRGRNLQ